ncbi:MAG: O-antigen ligase family protein [Oligoflexales bacterium]|nr:O-antigen ligase family protein [Oligoflexales bacterium]
MNDKCRYPAMPYNDNISKTLNLVVIVAACLTSVIVKLKVLSIPDHFRTMGYTNPTADVFSWYKSLFVTLCGAVALFILLVYKSFDQRKFRFIDCLLLSIAILAITSSIQASNRIDGIYGVPNIFEGIQVTIAYLVLVSASIRLSYLSTIKYLPIALLSTLILIGISGLAEANGIPLINHPLLTRLLMQEEGGWFSKYTPQVIGVALPFGNPVYLGMYAAMMWPFFGALTVTGKSEFQRMLFSIGAGAAFFLTLASYSRTAFIAGLISSCFGIIWLSAKRKITVLSVFLLIAAHFSAFSIFKNSKNYISGGYRLSLNDELDILQSPNITKDSYLVSYNTNQISNKKPDRIFISNGRLHINRYGQTLLIEKQLNGVRFMDGDFKPLLSKSNQERIEILDERFKSFALKIVHLDKLPLMVIDDLNIAMTPNGFRIGRAGIFVKPVVSQRFPLPINDYAFSSRGFIWSHTIPLLKDKWLTGSGPGSFPFEFPNNDVSAMHPFFGFTHIVDKPHNLYLSFAHSYGILALFLLLSIFLWHFFHSLRILLKYKDERADNLLPYILGFLSFSLSAIFHDSTIGVATPFWIILGAGMGINCSFK